MQLTTVTVTVAGKNYQLSGTEEAAHFQRLAQLTDRRIKEVAGNNNSLGAEACAVAAALSLADELVKAQALNVRIRAQLEELQDKNADET